MEVVQKSSLIEHPYHICMGELDQQKVSQIYDMCQNFFLGAERVSRFTLFLESEGGHPRYVKNLAYQLKLCQDKGVDVAVCVERYAMSAAAVLMLYAKYYGLTVYAAPFSIVIFHEPKQANDLMSISMLQKKVERSLEDFRETLEAYSEVSGIEIDRLREECEKEKELNVDTLYERNLIDAIVT